MSWFAPSESDQPVAQKRQAPARPEWFVHSEDQANDRSDFTRNKRGGRAHVAPMCEAPKNTKQEMLRSDLDSQVTNKQQVFAMQKQIKFQERNELSESDKRAQEKMRQEAELREARQSKLRQELDTQLQQKEEAKRRQQAEAAKYFEQQQDSLSIWKRQQDQVRSSKQQQADHRKELLLEQMTERERAKSEMRRKEVEDDKSLGSFLDSQQSSRKAFFTKNGNYNVGSSSSRTTDSSSPATARSRISSCPFDTDYSQPITTRSRIHQGQFSPRAQKPDKKEFVSSLLNQMEEKRQRRAEEVAADREYADRIHQQLQASKAADLEKKRQLAEEHVQYRDFLAQQMHQEPRRVRSEPYNPSTSGSFLDNLGQGNAGARGRRAFAT